LTVLLLATTLAFALPPASSTWTDIQSDPVHIACTTWEGRPYCRSTGVIGVPNTQAAATFADLDRFVKQMGAISRVDRLEPDVLHVVMDYPFPLDDRDYVARFSHRVEADGTEVFGWVPVEHPKAPPEDGIVRLSWLDGEWRFAAEGTNTRVTYLWEADPGGNLPDVRAVRSKAGTLAIGDIANACGTKVLAP
jgi:hypothetical protein